MDTTNKIKYIVTLSNGTEKVFESGTDMKVVRYRAYRIGRDLKIKTGQDIKMVSFRLFGTKKPRTKKVISVTN